MKSKTAAALIQFQSDTALSSLAGSGIVEYVGIVQVGDTAYQVKGHRFWSKRTQTMSVWAHTVRQIFPGCSVRRRELRRDSGVRKAIVTVFEARMSKILRVIQG